MIQESDYMEYKIRNKTDPGGRQCLDVLEFIAGFLWHHATESDADHVRDLFRAGYCYHFAVMLQAAFQRGTVCHKYPYGHMVWLDDDGNAYDIDGLVTDYQELIPVGHYGPALCPFLHDPGRSLPGISEQHAIVERIRKSYALDENGVRRMPIETENKNEPKP